MLSNNGFLKVIEDSFRAFINSGTSRSTAKLKPLHGKIARDIAERIGTDDYEIRAYGYEDGREDKIKGRYIDKRVDIAIKDKITQKYIAGIAVKFVMQNYSQNSNNYFENMLGETANIRTTKCKYFQTFIILHKLPYYKKSGIFTKWEEFTEHNMDKYCKLSKDNIDVFLHTPNKTLICVVKVTPDIPNIVNKKDYIKFYINNIDIVSAKYYECSYNKLIKPGNIIINDYESFIEKLSFAIKSI